MTGDTASFDPDGRPWSERAAELAETLAGGYGYVRDTTLADKAWRRAYDAAPRYLFVPDAYWAPSTRGPGLHALQRTDPEHERYWWDVVYGDHLIVTQVDGGLPHLPGAVGAAGTSSISQPSYVFAMLGHLGVDDGMRVLEVGTGTGWNAALLSARLGDDAVVSVEVDTALAASARDHLAVAGRHPLVVTGDGRFGCPDRAMYDRIISTCAVYEVPDAWIEQVTPGGVIVVPYATAFHDGALLRLTARTGGSASGPVVMDAPFMPIRGQRPLREPEFGSDDMRTRSTALDPRALVDADAAFAIGLLLPGVRSTSATAPYVHRDERDAEDDAGDADGLRVWLSAADGSWATAATSRATANGGPWDVALHGPRDLWDEAESAYQVFHHARRPPRTRFGLTARVGEAAWTWLDTPGHRWP